MILNRQLIKQSRVLKQIKYTYLSQKKIDNYLEEVNTSTYFGKLKYVFYYMRYVMKEGMT